MTVNLFISQKEDISSKSKIFPGDGRYLKWGARGSLHKITGLLCMSEGEAGCCQSVREDLGSIPTPRKKENRTEKENKDRAWPQGGEEGSHCCCSPKPIMVRAAAVSRERWLLKRVLA